MAQFVSSAEPEKLFRYSSFGMQVDRELTLEAARLASALQHFEATCTEPGFQVGVGHLGDGLRGYAGQSESVDSWVRQVGLGFQMADRGGVGTALRPGDIISVRWLLPRWIAGVISVLPLLSALPDWLTRLVRSLSWVRSDNTDMMMLGIPRPGEMLYQATVFPSEHKSWESIRSTEIALTQQVKDLEGYLEDLGQQEQQLLERQRQIEAELEQWQNRIIPDTPVRIGFDDGVLDAPWRTKADALEDEITAIDARLHEISEGFQGAKQALGQTRQAYEDVVRIKGNWILRAENEEDRAHTLNLKIEPSSFDPETGCARYAQSRRTDLGTTGAKDGGAAGYIETGKAKPYTEIVGESQDLRESVKPGFALVWPRKHDQLKGSAGHTYGHVAIVEEVGAAYVKISQAGWGEKYTMTLTSEELKSLYFVP
jgi:hypothetical protein